MASQQQVESKLEILNSAQHRDLRLRPGAPPVPHFVPIVLSEFASAAVSCPILLAKSPETGRFYAGALFGFKPGENFVSGEPGAGRAFRPLDIERQGFFVSGENIAIDVEHSRISKTEGEPLFDADGEATGPLRRIQQAIGLLVSGLEETDAFIAQLVELRLAEPIDIDLRFDDGESLRLDGLYTVSLDSLHDLEDEPVLKLFRSGYLHLAYTMADSLRQIPVLAHRRNQRIAEGAPL